MSNTNTGGPAFPVKQYNRNIMAFEEVCGLTLRDYFAAKAMQSAFSEGNFTFTLEDYRHLAKVSYAVADAMLKTRDA